MRKTETVERERFRIWAISAVLPLAGQGAKDFIADITSSCLMKMDYRTFAGMIYAAHIVRSC